MNTIFATSFLALVTLTSATAQISYTGLTYSENFDGLSSAANGTSATYTDGTTLTSWTVNSEEMDSNSDEYFTGSGSSNGGEVFSFGADEASDRALGYIGSGGNDYFNAAVNLSNDTGATVTGLVISYTGEQWRSGGDSSDNLNFLNFSYRIFSSGSGSVPASTDLTGWTEVDSLDFSAPQPNIASGALDGNLAANRTSLSSTITLSWSAGDELWIRFTGNNGAGTDAGLAIDDFSVSAVPEPGSYALLAGLLGLGYIALRRRN